LLYRLLKIPARIAFYFYCRALTVNNKQLFRKKGPLLISANHPNGFLDAIVLSTLFKQPIYSLARGDAFANNFYSRILRSLNMLPIYRISEGVENLEHNYSTFEACIDIFKKGGIVLIFSEGESINDWHLRPLKKGTARLAMTAWSQEIPLEVLPTGISYGSFRSFGKNISIQFGEVIAKKDIEANSSSGSSILLFNSLLQERLEKLVYPTNQVPSHVPSLLKKYLLFVPSLIGYIIHYPLRLLVNGLIKKKEDDLYDSIVIGLLFILYPFYVLIISLIGLIFINIYSLLLIFLIPFTGWAHLQLKKRA
jgi:1-acyl-sn-glycerol-3-phosphate acyltransferase